jgi:hypothetical protein
MAGEEASPPNEYTCAMCKGIFEKTWPDEEALAETRQYFGAVDVRDCAVVCDDCFQKVHPKRHPDLVRQVKEAAMLDALRRPNRK